MRVSYHTAQQKRILELLKAYKDRHLTAEEVFILLRENGEPVGQTTVYRQLDKLCAEGIVRKFDGAQGAGACYQYAENGHVCCRHYHLKCTDCGKLFHAECAFLDEIAAHIQKEHGFSIDGSRTIFYGLCADCAKKKESTCKSNG